MISIVILVLCLIGAEAAPKTRIQGRIVGGKDAEIGQFPYHVALSDRLSFRYFCGGSIITNWHILSAAHCVVKRSAAELLAILGSSSLNEPKFYRVGIEIAMAHPKYTDDSIRYDISILLSRKEIIFNDHIQPIQLPMEDFTKDSGTVAKIAGWGAMAEPKGMYDYSTHPINLQYQQTTILNVIECWDTYQQLDIEALSKDWAIINEDLDQSMVCTSNVEKSGTCAGDSGGGVVVNDVLVGIVSSSYGCAKGLPDFHTSVISYIPWIHEQMDHLHGTSHSSTDIDSDGDYS